VREGLSGTRKVSTGTVFLFVNTESELTVTSITRQAVGRSEFARHKNVEVMDGLANPTEEEALYEFLSREGERRG
jgi:hypothetical protein